MTPLTDKEKQVIEKEAEAYALKWIPDFETDDYWDKKNKKEERLSIEEHYENGATTERQRAKVLVEALQKILDCTHDKAAANKAMTALSSYQSQ